MTERPELLYVSLNFGKEQVYEIMSETCGTDADPQELSRYLIALVDTFQVGM
jgi:hypothetical protein